jgi:hypothetical protein
MGRTAGRLARTLARLRALLSRQAHRPPEDFAIGGSSTLGAPKTPARYAMAARLCTLRPIRSTDVFFGPALPFSRYLVIVRRSAAAEAFRRNFDRVCLAGDALE